MDGPPFYHHPQFSHPLPPPPPFFPGNQLMTSSSSPQILISPPPTLRPANMPSGPMPSGNISSGNVSATTYTEDNNNTQAYFYPTFPPTRQARRYRSIKKVVPIQNGKLILECPVPRQYLDQVPMRDAREFNTMRYTAVTCDPSEYVQKGYILRQTYLRRETEIVICITMYNVCIKNLVLQTITYLCF